MEYSKVMYICGEETYLVQNRVKSIQEDFIKNHTDFNFYEFDRKITEEEAREQFDTYPMMSDKKMVVLHNIPETDDMLDVLKDIPDFCVVLILHDLDKRKKLYKYIKKVGAVEEFKSLKAYNLSSWIVEEGERQGIKLTKAHANKIIQLSGVEDMNNIRSEIVKLANMQQPITNALIEKVVLRSVEYSSFELVDAISKKNKKRAYSLVHDLCLRNEYLPLVVILISRNFAILKMMQTMSHAQITKDAKINAYSLKKLTGVEKKFSKESLIFLINVCAEIDFNMKDGMDHRTALEKLIGVIE